MGLFDFLKKNSTRAIKPNFIDNSHLYTRRIGIARDFAIILNDDNTLAMLGNNDNFRQLELHERIVKVTAAYAGYMGLTESGCVVTCGPAHEFERYHEIMEKTYYQSHGNAYEILLNNDTVTVTNFLYVIFPDAVDDPSSTILKKDDFMFIMDEWIRYSSDKNL